MLLQLFTASLATAEIGAPEDVELPVFLDERELGSVNVAFAPNGRDLLSLDAAAVLELLKPVLAATKFSELSRHGDDDGRLSPNDFGTSGIGLEYDPSELKITFVIPADMRRGVELRLGTGEPYHANPLPPEPPAKFSGYVNMRAAGDYIAGAGGAGWQPAVVDLDGAVNVYGTVLEGITTYRTGQSGGWARGDVRLVHDLVEDRIRLAAGDLTYNVAGFQGFQRVGGIGVGRAFNLQPYRSSAPTGQTTVLIDRQSRVDVLVNGLRVGTLNLGPGQYNVRDFPFAAGTNDVSLRVTDEAGRIQTIDFPFVFDSTVLAAGEQDFQYVLGFASTPTRKGRAYDEQEPVLSAYHALGLTNQFTLGLNAQASRHQQMAGIQVRAATTAGVFRLDAAGSSSANADPGYAAQLQYRYVDIIGEKTHGRSAELIASYRSRTFGGIGLFSPNNPVSVDIGARYGQRILGSVYGSLGMSWQHGRDNNPDSHSIDLGLSKQLFANFNAYMLLSRSKSAGARPQNRIFLSVSWFPFNSGHTISANHDSRSNDTRVQWHYSPSRTVNAVETDLTLSRNPGDYGVRAEADYTGYRFDTHLFHAAQIAQGDGANTYRTSLAAGTSLAFADGHVGVSRPITDSFALIAPHRSLRSHTVEVNSGTDAPEAKTDILGPAILPELTGYYRYQVLLSADELPEGLDLGRDFFTLRPSYRSGTVIPAGAGATVLLEADLVDFAGQALNLELGSISLAAAPNAPPIDFFTNREGRLRVLGIMPGKITLTLANYPEIPITVDIPKDTVGLYNAGKITVPVAALPVERGR